MNFKVVAKTGVEIVAELGPYGDLEEAKADAQELADKMADVAQVYVLDEPAQGELGLGGPVPYAEAEELEFHGPELPEPQLVIEEGGFPDAPYLNPHGSQALDTIVAAALAARRTDWGLEFPPPPRGPDPHTQAFDDWAADVAGKALQSGVSDPAVRAALETIMNARDVVAEGDAFPAGPAPDQDWHIWAAQVAINARKRNPNPHGYPPLPYGHTRTPRLDYVTRIYRSGPEGYKELFSSGEPDWQGTSRDTVHWGARKTERILRSYGLHFHDLEWTTGGHASKTGPGGIYKIHVELNQELGPYASGPSEMSPEEWMAYRRRWELRDNPPEDRYALDGGQEALLAEIVLVAENQGQFYPGEPAKAVDFAIAEHRKTARWDLQYDASVIRSFAVRDVHASWRRRNPALRENASGALRKRLPKRIEIEGTRWRDSNGNTYHKAYISFDGKLVHESPITYGYGSHYEDTTAKEWLVANRWMPSDKSPWRYFRDEKGLQYSADHEDVSRKRDL